MTTTQISFAVKKEKIAENGDYNLTGDCYRETVDYSNAKWPMVELGEVCEIYNGSTPKRTEKEYWENGTIPWFTIEDIREQGRIIKYTKQTITESGYKNSSVKLLPKNSVLLCCPASIGEFAFSEIELTTNQQFNGLVVKEEFKNQLNPKFLFQVASKFKSELERLSGKTSFGFVSVGTLKQIKIPLPPLPVQEQIVAEIEQYQKVIDGAKQVVENWKPSFRIDPSWEMVELGEVGKVSMCKRIFKEETTNEGDIPFYKIGTFGKNPDAFIKKEQFEEYRSKFSYPKKGEILISTSGTIGKTVIFDGEPAYFQDSNIVWIENDEKKVLNSYLNLIYQTINWLPATGVTIARLYNKIIEETKIIVPSLSVQEQIVAEIEAEQRVVNTNEAIYFSTK